MNGLDIEKKEVMHHLKHLEVTLDRIISFLYPDGEFARITEYLGSNVSEKEDLYARRSAWIRTSDLAVQDITTEKMALIHMLWFQSIGRIVIEDIDPYSGAVLLHLSFGDIVKGRKTASGNPS